MKKKIKPNPHGTEEEFNEYMRQDKRMQNIAIAVLIIFITYFFLKL